MPESETGVTAEALRQQIAERAYAFWEQEGCPHGRDLDHWLQAEAEIAAGRSNPPDAAAQTASRGRKAETRAA